MSPAAVAKRNSGSRPGPAGIGGQGDEKEAEEGEGVEGGGGPAGAGRGRINGSCRRDGGHRDRGVEVFAVAEQGDIGPGGEGSQDLVPGALAGLVGGEFLAEEGGQFADGGVVDGIELFAAVEDVFGDFGLIELSAPGEGGLRQVLQVHAELPGGGEPGAGDQLPLRK